ncbi:MAG: hypothetical protein M1826_003560 [Phylliscum demangeonii]|nr:MAG: hypothetical protein M1826_003560 [Phylliscum demangeonii]
MAQTDDGLPAPSLSAKDEDPSLDARSSSLSDIDDVLVDEGTGGASSVAGGPHSEYDSEAETERLENSPTKQRTRNVLLRSSPRTSERSTRLSEPLATPEPETKFKKPSKVTLKGAKASTAVGSNGGTTEDDLHASPEAPKVPADVATPEMSSPPEAAPQSRKRSRANSRSASDSDDAEAEEPLRKRIGSIKASMEGGSSASQIKTELVATREQADSEMVNVQANELAQNDITEHPLASTEEVAVTPSAGRKGRRKGHRESTTQVASATVAASPREEQPPEGRDGNKDVRQVSIEDEEEDIGTPARNEEGAHRKSDAYDALGHIEKQFAAFRDKLYDERQRQLSDELASLQGPNQTHAEYLAKMQCINARRDGKIDQELKLLRYKTEALQRETLAMRSQIHGQYSQNIRSIRERILEDAGLQWYRIQRERRGFEGTIPDYTTSFPTRRSQQVAQQMAYNAEVSILAGVAKYVGFPAAPEVEGARPEEAESDLLAMGL